MYISVLRVAERPHPKGVYFKVLDRTATHYIVWSTVASHSGHLTFTMGKQSDECMLSSLSVQSKISAQEMVPPTVVGLPIPLIK